MNRTKIEWTDATWNPLRGCSRVSEGCRNCYAERVAARFSGPGMPYEGLARFVRGVPVEIHENIRFESEGRWTGKVALVEDALLAPYRWKRPRRIFVNSMSDLFHESVPDEWIDRIFAVMAQAQQHTFQVLTKRPDRMYRYLKDSKYGSERWTKVWNAKVHAFGKPVSPMGWPLPNVWLGVSAEDQASFKKRVGALLATPAAVRWVSAEPLLEGIELHDGFWRTTRDHTDEYESVPLKNRLDWVVIGGESGPGARPFCIDSAYEMIGQCSEAGVPVFVKQLGAKPYTWNANRWDFAEHVLVKEPSRAVEDLVSGGCAVAEYWLENKKGGDMTEWPKELRVREFARVLAGAPA